MKITQHTTLENNETVEQWAAARELSIAEALRILAASNNDLSVAQLKWENGEYDTDHVFTFNAVQYLGSISSDDHDWAMDAGLIYLQENPDMTVGELAYNLESEIKDAEDIKRRA